MPVLTVFNLTTMNAEKYHLAISGLAAAGQGNPKGRLYHIASPQADGTMMVTDVWESAEALEQFGAVLVPVLNKAGVTPVPPVIHPVLNIIAG